jgi:toxin ParE1/3/4
MKTTISDKAQAELREIGDWIADDNPARADSFVLELIDRCRAIGPNPTLYPVASNIPGTAVRRRLYKGYLIFYRVKIDEVEIIHIVHSMRNYAALFEQDDHTNE